MVKRFIISLFLLLPLLSVAQPYLVKDLSSTFTGDVFSPAFFGSKLVVCSNQKDRVLRTVLDTNGNEPVNLWVVDPDTVIRPKKRLKGIFRTTFNDGPVTFNSSGTRCVISRNLKNDHRFRDLQNDHNPLGLYMSDYENSSWLQLTPMPFNDTVYSCSHPALNDEGDVLIFSSNMPGGCGGYDLWMSTFSNDTWEKPVNLGAKVNTEHDEVFPSISGEYLCFSSDRGAIGGLDIYRVNLKGGQKEVSLMGDPINSEFDDFGMASKNGCESGFLTSNRGGKDELWSFEIDYPSFSGCDSLVENQFCYTIYEENSEFYEDSDSGALIYEWKINEIRKKGMRIDYCFPEPGTYEISLDITDTVLKKTYYDQTHYSFELKAEEQPFIDSPDTVLVGEEFLLSGKQTYLPRMQIDEYFWSVEDDRKMIGRDVKHKFLHEGTYTITLGVTGYEGEQRVSDCVYKTIVCKK